MFEDTRNSLAKLKENLDGVSGGMKFWGNGEPFVATGSMEVELSGTLFFINAVSLLDEGLTEYIAANFACVTSAHTKDLNAKINFLDAQAKVNNAADLHKLRKKRNEFAHNPGNYGNLDDLRWAIAVLETTFYDLDIL
jgi:hypothetical protein